jgi:hypothetical protein
MYLFYVSMLFRICTTNNAGMRITKVLNSKCTVQGFRIVSFLESSLLSFELQSRWRLCINRE